MSNKLLVLSLAVNVLALSALFYLNFQEVKQVNSKELNSDEFYDELCPTVIYNKNETVDISFSDTGVAKRGKKRYENCINPEVTNPKLILLYIKKCLPLFKEYKPRGKKLNKKLVKSCPNYVPTFQESSSVVDYPYEKVDWKKLYKTPLKKVNLLNKLGFYTRNKGFYFLRF